MSKAIRTGCKLVIEKPYFNGSYRNAKFAGIQTIKVEVLRHSYGAIKGQHTFTLEVIEIIEQLDHRDAHKKGDNFRIKGRNLYPNVIDHYFQSEESKNASKAQII